MIGADMGEATLSRVDLSRATLSGATLSRVDLSGANLSGARGFRSATIQWVIINDQTQFPDGFSSPYFVR
jgi:uncharacterized protein YjbI with pentapeptide repeats